VAQVVECLLSKHEALSSNLSTSKKKREREKAKQAKEGSMWSAKRSSKETGKGLLNWRAFSCLW
jgi:hypothetical protein